MFHLKYWLFNIIINYYHEKYPLLFFTVGQDESQEKIEMIETNLGKGKPVVKSRFDAELFIYD